MFHILKVCVKHWRCCCGACVDFEPATPTKKAVASLDCRFKRNVYLSTKEIKFLVRRARVYEPPPERRVKMSLMDVGKGSLNGLYK